MAATDYYWASLLNACHAVLLIYLCTAGRTSLQWGNDTDFSETSTLPRLCKAKPRRFRIWHTPLGTLLSLILEAWQYHILKMLQNLAWYKHLNWSLFILEHHFESFSHFYILGVPNCHSTNSTSHPVPASKRQSLTKLDGLSAVFLLKIIAVLEIGSQTS